MRTSVRLSVSSSVMFMLMVALSVPAWSGQENMPMKGRRGGPGPMMGMGGPDRMGEMMGTMMGMCLEHAEELGLTGEQLAKLKPVHREMEKLQARYGGDLKIAEIERAEIMEAKDFDLPKAEASVRKIAEIKTAHQLAMLKAMKEVRTVLTSEQFEKMKQWMPLTAGGMSPDRRPMPKSRPRK